jgi:hypothetical protein
MSGHCSRPREAIEYQSMGLFELNLIRCPDNTRRSDFFNRELSSWRLFGLRKQVAFLA